MAGTVKTGTACPGCEANNIDESLEEFDAVCDSCGLVVHDFSEPDPPDWIATEAQSEEPETPSWSEYCCVRNATEKQLASAFEALESIADPLRVSRNTREEAVEIYCEAFQAETTNGRDTASFIAACLRLASLQSTTPIPQSRLVEQASVDKQKFRGALRTLRDERDDQVESPSPIDYLPFVSTALNLTESQVEHTAQVLREVDANSLFIGKDPTGITAATAYLTTMSYTQAEVADVAGVSTETIRLRVAELQELVSHD